MSASIINTGTNTKIFSNNNVNKIEVSTENIIQSDSESREVVKKGYLLSKINLTSIPDIIQDAINEAMLDTKEQTLADALIETLRLSISNLDDGVYKKTYIDNTISYIENLVVSKVSPETVAAIADSKLAIALEGFATTSSVSTLSSRVENSEIEISNVKQTINTKDTAIATQMEEMEARVNDTFAGYSDAIDLYVDAEGNVKSEKIEKLEANNSMATVSINEQNKITLDAQGNYVAFVAKFIADSDGKIVGYNFSDTNDLTTFTINADVFKISNSDNSYTPFTIDGNNILFNGKMTFANVTGTDGVVTTSNVQTVFNSEVTSIDGGKITTNSIGANQINTTGLIAENISADTLIGKNFIGGKFTGALLEGAVIKASYLDLDGELEVLTNYHITPAMYAANPSLYTDAVYIEGNDEYRIPSLSTVREATQTRSSTSIGALSGKIYSYNTANVNSNLKAVKITPTFINTSDIKLIDLTHGSIATNGGFNDSYGVRSNISIMLGEVKIFEYHAEHKRIDAEYSGIYEYRIVITINRYGLAPIVISEAIFNGYRDYTTTWESPIGNMTLSFNLKSDGEDGNIDDAKCSLVLTLNAGSVEVPFHFVNGNIKINNIVVPQAYRPPASATYITKCIFELKDTLSINNMI